MAIAILSKYLIDDLVDRICEPVHRLNMVDVQKEIVSFPSVFEKALSQSLILTKWAGKGDDEANDLALLEILREKHEVRYFLDDYIYWNTDLYIIDDNKFVFIHSLHDGEDRDHLIVEGFLENETIKIERFYYKSWTKESVCLSLETMLEKHNHVMITSIPFQFLMEKMLGKYCDRHMIDFNYHSGKSWRNVDFMVKHYFERE